MHSGIFYHSPKKENYLQLIYNKTQHRCRINNKKVQEGVEFHCEICDKNFAYKKRLQRHKGNIHKVEKVFKP